MVFLELNLNKIKCKVFNVRKSHVDESFILRGHTRCFNVGTKYCNCIMNEKVNSLKHIGLHIDYKIKWKY